MSIYKTEIVVFTLTNKDEVLAMRTETVPAGANDTLIVGLAQEWLLAENERRGFTMEEREAVGVWIDYPDQPSSTRVETRD